MAFLKEQHDHVDTGRFGKGSEQCGREDRVCLVCMSGSVEDEHLFLFECPAYSCIQQQYRPPVTATFFTRLHLQ